MKEYDEKGVLNHVSIAERIPCPTSLSAENNNATPKAWRFSISTDYVHEVSEFNKKSEGLLI